MSGFAALFFVVVNRRIRIPGLLPGVTANRRTAAGRGPVRANPGGACFVHNSITERLLQAAARQGGDSGPGAVSSV